MESQSFGPAGKKVDVINCNVSQHVLIHHEGICEQVAL